MRCVVGLAVTLCVASCHGDVEWQIRQAVKRVAAGEHDAERAADFVVAKGRYALPEIEQQLHAAEPKARLRLIAVVRRIGEPEAARLMRILARHADDDEVAAAAKAAASALSASSNRKR